MKKRTKHFNFVKTIASYYGKKKLRDRGNKKMSSERIRITSAWGGLAIFEV